MAPCIIFSGLTLAPPENNGGGEHNDESGDDYISRCMIEIRTDVETISKSSLTITEKARHQIRY